MPTINTLSLNKMFSFVLLHLCHQKDEAFRIYILSASPLFYPTIIKTFGTLLFPLSHLTLIPK